MGKPAVLIERNLVVTLPLSKEEKGMLEQLALRQGISMSGVLRQLLKAEWRRVEAEDRARRQSVPEVIP